MDKVDRKSIYAMTKEELYNYCHECALSEEDCRISYCMFYEKLKGKPLYDAIGYSKRHTIRKRKELLKILIKK